MSASHARVTIKYCPVKLSDQQAAALGEAVQRTLADGPGRLSVALEPLAARAPGPRGTRKRQLL